MSCGTRALLLLACILTIAYAFTHAADFVRLFQFASSTDPVTLVWDTPTAMPTAPHGNAVATAVKQAAPLVATPTAQPVKRTPATAAPTEAGSNGTFLLLGGFLFLVLILWVRSKANQPTPAPRRMPQRRRR